MRVYSDVVYCFVLATLGSGILQDAFLSTDVYSMAADPWHFQTILHMSTLTERKKPFWGCPRPHRNKVYNLSKFASLR